MISLSSKGRYAIRAMLELGLRNNKNPVLLRDIAKTQKISQKYLERIMVALVSAGLVYSKRGQKGGFSLAKKPADINVLQIIQAVEGPVNPVPCVQSPHVCCRSKICVTRDIWVNLKNAVVSVLDDVSLDDLTRMHTERMKSADAQMYSI